MDAWIRGNGAVAINGLMEDAATAEIARSQLWQWLRNGSHLADGRQFSESVYNQFRMEEVGKLLPASDSSNRGSLDLAVDLLDHVVTSPSFIEFLTLPGYRCLE